MKTHAIPQDIMKVEFKLFGNFLSLREFIFIAVGIALAYFFYFLMQKGVIPGILAIPSIMLFGLGGIMLGLVPIQDQSLDKWILYYIAAIRKPTQRVWRKPGYHEAPNTDSPVVAKDHVVTPPNQQTTTMFAAGNIKKRPRADAATIAAEKDEVSELTRIQNTIEKIEEKPSATQQTTTQTAPSQAQRSTPQAQAATVPPPLVRQAVAANTPIPTRPDPQAAAATSSNARPGTDQIDNTNLMTAKQDSKMITPSNFKPSQRPTQPAPPQPKPPGKGKPASNAAKGGKVLEIDDSNIKEFATEITSLEPQTNTINIVVKDTNGLILPGVVSVIKNAKGDPVRAAISNILGQVLNNVPLKDGVYNISLSKQGYVFPEITRSLTGKKYPPIEIRSL